MEQEKSRQVKFCAVTPETLADPEQFRWPAHYYWQHLAETSRLCVAISEDPIKLILELASACGEPYGILHVIKVALQSKAGRYQLKQWLTYDDLDKYLNYFEGLLTQDGRQETWIRGDAWQIVYDHHEILFLYGPLEVFENILKKRGFSEGDFRIPSPHRHCYHEEFNPAELMISQSDHYLFTELQDVDFD